MRTRHVYCARHPFNLALAVAVHAPALAVASAAGEALTIPRCAGSPAATEVAARLDTVSDAACVAEEAVNAFLDTNHVMTEKDAVGTIGDMLEALQHHNITPNWREEKADA